MRVAMILLALTWAEVGCNALPVRSDTRLVGSDVQLAAALKVAKGGERIMLRPGNYGLVVVQNRTWPKPVTIESADPARPATISRFLAVNTTGMTLRNLEFTRSLGAERVWAKIAEITGGADIRFEGGSFHGSLDGDPSNDMQGLSARGTKNLVVSGMKFQDLNLGFICDDCSDLVVRNSVFSFLATDAMNIPGARGATITDNFFHDFRPIPGAHPDGIQCWTLRKISGCKDVAITGNTFRGDPGHEFQGVFFGDEAKVGGYDRILIANNSFVCTLWHAVNISLGSDIQIIDNEIVAGPNYKPWFRTNGPARVIGNIAPAYVIENRQGVPAGNRLGGAFKK
ncbi:right-handed parallel beta-helix repeat-containing protein [Sphingomonas elodea]|uniref:right-handed parallel beta-helix repeat-containing protein n=1 Tax=Sphingomonas elodea TaxID=179878 RepID=UPI0002630760|nr:right-handed parallel beta-helix repeat-containing protein [Sphingomonas elodea]